MESLIFLEIEEIENTGEIIVPGNKCLMIRSNKNIVKGVNFVWNLGLFIGNIAAGDWWASQFCITTSLNDS